MPLTDMTLRNAKPREREYQLRDTEGLYVLVRPDGKMWWRQDFVLLGRRRRMGLGTYPQIGLGVARKERDRVKGLVAAGLDPVKERKYRAADPEDALRFETVARDWLEANRPAWTTHYYDITETRLENHIFPHIGRRNIASLTPLEVLEVIQKIEVAGSIDLSRRLNTVVGRIFRFGLAKGLVDRDPTSDIRDALKKRPPVKHRASIKPKDMGAFLLKLAEDGDEEVDTLEALWLTILTADRTVETRFADRQEFDGLGTPNSLWRIPPERMKKNREHLIPLSRQADELVRRRIDRMRPGQTLLFARNTRSGTISENTMLYAMYRLGYRGRATVHGFRGTFSTLANSATKFVGGEEMRMWEPDWIEWALSHVEDDEVRAAYNAAEYLPQRRRLLQWWANWLDEQLELARLIG